MAFAFKDHRIYVAGRQASKQLGPIIVSAMISKCRCYENVRSRLRSLGWLLEGDDA